MLHSIALFYEHKMMSSPILKLRKNQKPQRDRTGECSGWGWLEFGSSLMVHCEGGVRRHHAGSNYIFIFLGLFHQMGAHSSTVGWGTVIQARRSGVPFLTGSLGFLITLILSAAVRLWRSTQPLTEIRIRDISLGKMAACALGWQPKHLHVLTV
jgi:hypothetical protein